MYSHKYIVVGSDGFFSYASNDAKEVATWLSDRDSKDCNVYVRLDTSPFAIDALEQAIKGKV